MGRSKRDVRAAAEESTTPPAELTAQQSMARVLKAEGNSLYSCVLPDKSTVIVQLQDRFRNTIWIRRGGYVLVDLTPTEEHKGKVKGDIVNIVREEKEWRKQSYWPKEFAKASAYAEDSDEEESTAGRMPPLDSESED